MHQLLCIVTFLGLKCSFTTSQCPANLWSTFESPTGTILIDLASHLISIKNAKQKLHGCTVGKVSLWNVDLIGKEHHVIFL